MNKYNKIKKRTSEVLAVASEGDTLSKIVDIFLITLIGINVIIVILETFDLPQIVYTIMSVIETASVLVFTIEYILRVWVADRRVRYIFSLTAIIDLLAILPFYLPFVSANLVVLRLFRIIRLLRLFKLDRYTTALHTISAVFRRKAHQLISSMFVVLLLMVIASVLMYGVEHDAQPDVFSNALSGLWWAIATLTTVGYGDIYPITAFGKVLSAIIALLGIGLVAVPTGIITSGFSEQIDDEAKVDVFAPSQQDESTVAIIEKMKNLDALQKAKLLVYADDLKNNDEKEKVTER